MSRKNIKVSSTVYLDLPDKYDDDGEDSVYEPCGSLIVKPGCTLHAYPQPGFTDWRDSYQGPLLLTNVDSPVPGELGNV